MIEAEFLLMFGKKINRKLFLRMLFCGRKVNTLPKVKLQLAVFPDFFFRLFR